MLAATRINKIFKPRGRYRLVVRVNNDQLDLHFFGNNAFYVNRRALSRKNALAEFRKTCKIRAKLNENPVAFNASNDPSDRLALL